MQAAKSFAPPPPSVPLARAPVDLARVGRLLADAVTDPGPLDPYRLDGRDPELVSALLPLFERIAESYLGLELEGLEHVARGPALYVGNHNGGILGPDLFCTLAALWRRLGADTPLHPLAHDLAMVHLPPLGRVLARVGALRAHPWCARRALSAGRAVLVYPGGEHDAYRPFWQRDRIVLGSRTGFLRIARDAGAPIVPIVAEGAHSSAIFFHQGRWIASLTGLRRFARIEHFPLALGLPWGIGAGPWVPYLPLPLRVRIRILPPRRVPQGADLADVQGRLVAEMQSALDELAAR